MTERDIEGRKPYEKPAIIATIKAPPHVVEMLEMHGEQTQVTLVDA